MEKWVKVIDNLQKRKYTSPPNTQKISYSARKSNQKNKESPNTASCLSN